MFPNLAHSRVARNGKMCAQELPKVAIMLCFQIWFILELPAQELPKVAIMLCSQIWFILELPPLAVKTRSSKSNKQKRPPTPRGTPIAKRLRKK